MRLRDTTGSCALIVAFLGACWGCDGFGQGAADAPPDVVEPDVATDAPPETTPEYPGPTSSCNELGAWLEAYAGAHAGCSVSSDCIAVLEVGGSGECSPCYFHVAGDSTLAPALNETAATREFTAVRSWFDASCAETVGPYLRCLSDSVASVAVGCTSGRCVARVSAAAEFCRGSTRSGRPGTPPAPYPSGPSLPR